ncbi:hypothetical protein [Deinococcus cavernae]|uniref:hypothetical protein n=1 Tax=Deinococcus cavernae TaxID=2320857 RepID=UPI0011C21DDA|nr:hypothetical protein [Deinococcus cavernae]
MTDVHEQLESAASTFWQTFNESWMAKPAAMACASFTKVDKDSGGGLRGGVGQGEFYGRSDLILQHENGALYWWTVGMLYETGWNGPEFWEQGAGYSYVAVCPQPHLDGYFVPIYSIGDTDFPASPITVEKWLAYTEAVKDLSWKCLQDLEFVFTENLAGKLHELSLTAPESQFPNPFKSAGQLP